MVKATIRTPVKGFTGKVGTVAFADGVGTLELPDPQLSYFRRHGYKVELSKGGSSSSGGSPEIPEGDPTEKWTGAQLKAYAKDKGVDLGSAKSKDEILAAIATAADDGSGEDSDDGDGSGD